MKDQTLHHHTKALKRWVGLSWLWQTGGFLCWLGLIIALISWGISNQQTHTMSAVVASVLGIVLAVWRLRRTRRQLFTQPTHHPTDEHDVIVLKRAAAPQLFERVHTLSATLGIEPPETIYISAAVNAAVYYQHVWYSAFRPPTRQLIIGLGLVNWLNRTEFEAVLAHELAHVAQPEMIWSGYVQAIHRRLVRSVIEPRRLYFFGRIRKMLALFYLKTLHERHQRVVHQLEVLADETASRLISARALAQAVPKLDRADLCLQNALEQLATMQGQRLWTDDLFYHQRAMDKLVATQPHVDIPMFHPTSAQRVDQAQQRVRDDEHIEEASAWTYFEDPKHLRHQVTANLLGRGNIEHAPPMAPAEEVQKQIEQLWKATTIPAKYNGYYEPRCLNIQPDAPQAPDPEQLQAKLEQLWGESFAAQMTRLSTHRQNISLLDQHLRQTPGQSLDFHGRTLTPADAREERHHQQMELAELEQWRARYDQHVAMVHLAIAEQQASQGDVLRALYQQRLEIERLWTQWQSIQVEIDRGGVHQLGHLYDRVAGFLKDAAQVTMEDDLGLDAHLLMGSLVAPAQKGALSEDGEDRAILFFAQCSEIYLAIQNVERSSMVRLVVFQEKIVHNWKTVTLSI